MKNDRQKHGVLPVKQYSRPVLIDCEDDMMGAGHFQEFEDEYLEALYEINERKPGQMVRNGELADYLSVTPASATEMVQRLAKNGFVDYVPYKGVLLTGKGLEHGKVMKRRHRLAEVLLSRLPFVGDIHETACRLEHAFNDDLEASISILLGNPETDPSGRQIPEPSNSVANKMKNIGQFILASDLKVGESGFITMIIATDVDISLFDEIGLKIDSMVKRVESGNLCIDGQGEISDYLSKRILLRWEFD